MSTSRSEIQFLLELNANRMQKQAVVPLLVAAGKGLAYAAPMVLSYAIPSAIDWAAGKATGRDKAMAENAAYESARADAQAQALVSMSDSNAQMANHPMAKNL